MAASLQRGLRLTATVFLLSAWVSASDLADDRYRLSVPTGLDLYMPVPTGNPLTPEKVGLGRRLFFDPILSRDFSVACATCHDPRRAFSDGQPRAAGIGGRINGRHAPALLNRGYGRAFFWDGRAASLEDQVLRPIEHPDELGHSMSELMLRLRGHPEYVRLFRAVFDRDPHAEDLARALASYVRTILSGDAPIDRYFAGERQALSAEQLEGLEVFRGKGRCTVCHGGPTFTDERFHNTGVAWQDGRLVDPGRAAITRDDRDRGAFKTPTLREVVRTAPYMHNGSITTLEEVVEWYSGGGRPNPTLDPDIRPIPFTPAEKRALVAFLGALSGTISEGRLIRVDPSDQGRRPTPLQFRTRWRPGL